MPTMIKEINSFSFIGNMGGQESKREWKEIDEEADIMQCKEKFDRPCLLLKPLDVLRTALPGDKDGTRHLPVLSNDQVSIELVTTTASSDETPPRLRGMHEVQVQLGEPRTTKTPQGDFELQEGDLLAIPPEVSRSNTGPGGTGNRVRISGH